MNILKKIFNGTKIEYNRLTKSELYYQSKWRARHLKDGKYKGYYTIYNREIGAYYDLVSSSRFTWKYSDRYFKDCVTTSKTKIIKTLKILINTPEKFKMSDEEKLDKFDIKIIEQYLRKKKLEKMK